MLKRGYGATVEEWLMAAEYIVSSGNPNVILCERGIRTFETYTRNTMDLAAVPLVHHLSHLPVIVDPSHATGKRWLVAPLAIGGVAVGADGVMVEVHPDPDAALSDAEQQLTLDQFRAMMAELVPVHEHVRSMYAAPIEAVAAARRLRRPREALTDGPPMTTTSIDAAIVTPAARLRGELVAARRQVDQPSGADARDCWPPARAGSRAPATAPTSARPPAICRALGATVERTAAGRTGAGRRERRLSSSRSPGVDGLREPAADLDCGNSGTSLRLFAGILAGLPFRSVLDGDDSLRRRPVARIIEPLRAMGATLRRPFRRFPPAADRHRSPAPSRRRSMDPGPERAGEVGDPPGGAPGRGPDDGPRGASRPAITPSGCCGRAASRSRRSDSRRPTPTAATGRWRSVSKEGGR